jgi:uncharacterized membrane protein HdeD (DUF308 family)
VGERPLNPSIQRGLAGFVFGLLAILGTDGSGKSIVPLLLFYALADGVLAISFAARAAFARESWSRPLADGAAGVAGLAIVTLWPNATSPALLWSIALWTTVTAATAIHAARERRLAAASVVLLRFGVVLLRFLVVGAAAARAGDLVLVLWEGANALLFAAVFLSRTPRRVAAPLP